MEGNNSTQVPQTQFEEIQDQQIPSNSSSKINIFIPVKVVLGIVILLVLSGVAFYFLNAKKTVTDNTIASKMDQGFTIKNEKNGKIYVYNIKTDKLTQKPVEGITSRSYGGSLGQGNTAINRSPDMTMSAVLDADTHDLYILTHESGTAERITSNGDVEYLTGWTKDSKHLLYYIGSYDAVSGEMPDDPNKGFYLLSIETKKSKKLEGIQSVLAFSNDKILINNRGQFSLYDIYTGAQDTSPFTQNYEKNGLFHQIDLSADAMHWAFATAQSDYQGNSPGKSEMYYAPIGQTTGQLIAQGGFADVQFPIISPDGNRIMYNTGGANLGSIVVVDIGTSREIARTEASVSFWVDNNTILTLQPEDLAEFHTYKIWDLEKNAFSDKINNQLPSSAFEVVNTDPFPERFKKSVQDIETAFKDYPNIPKELKKGYEENLIGLSCNEFSDYNNNGWEYTSKYSDGSEHSKHLLGDEGIISAINKTSDISLFGDGISAVDRYATVCKLEDGRIYIERTANGERTWNQKTSFMYSQGTLETLFKPNYNTGGGGGMGGCSLIQITKNSEYYYRCGFADGGGAVFNIEKIIPGAAPEILFNCQFAGNTATECTDKSTQPTL